MEPKSRDFQEAAHKALIDPHAYAATGRLVAITQANRARSIDHLPEFGALSDEAKEIKNHTLEHLDYYLEQFEEKVNQHGGKVHWCSTGPDACAAIVKICQAVGAKIVTKGKSMLSEEIGLNHHLEANGLTPIETDIGEYILQLTDEPPSHLVAPAHHKTTEQVADLLEKHHEAPGLQKEPPERLVSEFRRVLRPRYFEADVGITGANFLVAETGSVVIVTNEGNGDLTQTLPKVHIVIATIDKVLPTLEDATTFLRLLGRSAAGQEMTVYTTFSTGRRQEEDVDGPGEFHVVLVDAGRSEMLGTELQPLLRCIRCAACMNHCPVYRSAGGHAYGWVFPGPIGAALNPHLIGEVEAFHLPRATSVCRRCDEVCPVQIPLTGIMRHWRERAFEAGIAPQTERFGMRFWAFFARRPLLYRIASAMVIPLLGLLGRKRGRFRWFPLAAGWTAGRDLPAPEGGTFVASYKRVKGRAR